MIESCVANAEKRSNLRWEWGKHRIIHEKEETVRAKT